MNETGPTEGGVVPDEYNDDPQWEVMFLNNYRHLVAQEEKNADGGGGATLDEYEVVGDEEVKGSQSLLSMLSSAVGDMASITIPIGFCEPTSFLQRLAEAFRFSELLDRAADDPDPHRRMAFVACWFVSSYSSNVRTAKPFNPFLGETFEYVRQDPPLKYVAEQVSHHPPIAAVHAHNDKWELWHEKRVQSKFGGNSLTMVPLGSFHLVLKATNETFTWNGVNVTAHNVVVGSTWVEHFGETTIVNKATGAGVLCKFTKASWMSRNRYTVNCVVQDEKGRAQLTLTGKWNESMVLQTPGGRDELLWTNVPAAKGAKYGFNDFTTELNKFQDVRKLPATDSRLRADRLLLDQGDVKKAGGAKKGLENKQRAAAKERDAAGREWMPRFFHLVGTAASDDPNEWQFNGRYWDMREERLRKLTGKADTSKTPAAPAPSVEKSPRSKEEKKLKKKE